MVMIDNIASLFSTKPLTPPKKLMLRMQNIIDIPSETTPLTPNVASPAMNHSFGTTELLAMDAKLVLIMMESFITEG